MLYNFKLSGPKEKPLLWILLVHAEFIFLFENDKMTFYSKRIRLIILHRYKERKNILTYIKILKEKKLHT